MKILSKKKMKQIVDKMTKLLYLQPLNGEVAQLVRAPDS